MNSLRFRLVFSYSLIVTLTLSIALVAGFFLLRRQLINGTDFLLNAEYQEIEARLASLKPPISTAQIEDAISEHTVIDAPFYFFQVHEPAGPVLFRSANLASKVLPDLTAARLSRFTVDLDDLGLLRVAEYRAGELHVQIASSLEYLNSIHQRFFRVLLVLVSLVLLFSIGVGYALCEISLRPIRAIEQTARHISASNLKERIPLPRGRDEITLLAELLNAMFDRLDKSFEQIKQFTADFSHELRTPLSIIDLHLEKILKKSGLDPESAAAISEIQSETRRLNSIIDQLLTLAKAEAHTLPINRVPSSASQFISDFAEDAAALSEASGKQFSLVENEDLSASFDASWIRQVLFNLLSNAIKFSPPNGKIELASRKSGAFWRFSFRDEGPGIPKEDQEKVFQRFKQLRPGPDAHQGAGLGLAVSKGIVELHNGSIRIESPSERDRGAMIVVQIPLTNTA